ncbi:PiggyBac transposable element-derived protein 4 [Anthophora retusa]
MHTNNKARESVLPNQKWKLVDETEIDAFFGLLLLIGRFRESRERKQDLWKQNTSFSRSYYAAIMSRDRFTNILKYIRFDESATRDERKSTDKLAPLRQVVHVFTENCKKSYNATNTGCVDEQLMTFRGRCSFKEYMPSKPGKYGIKIWTLCDTTTFYCCNIDVYLGKIANAPEKQQESRVVKQLTSFWKNSKRCVTMDNFFTDITLAEDLLKDQISIVGTIRKNRKDLPKVLTDTRNRAQYSSYFLYTNKVTLVSYIPKARKCVTLLSTLHHEHEISQEQNNFKPEIILFYNSTKSGVDSLDKLLREYTCRRCTRRWPLSLFMHLLDIAAYNAFVIWMTKYPTWGGTNSVKNKRKLFLQELAKNLTTKNIDARASAIENQEIRYHKHVVNAIEVTGRKLKINKPQLAGQKRARCYMCIGNNNKYFATCDICNKHICTTHCTQSRAIICNGCNDTNSE